MKPDNRKNEQVTFRALLICFFSASISNAQASLVCLNDCMASRIEINEDKATKAIVTMDQNGNRWRTKNGPQSKNDKILVGEHGIEFQIWEEFCGDDCNAIAIVLGIQDEKTGQYSFVQSVSTENETMESLQLSSPSSLPDQLSITDSRVFRTYKSTKASNGKTVLRLSAKNYFAALNEDCVVLVATEELAGDFQIFPQHGK